MQVKQCFSKEIYILKPLYLKKKGSTKVGNHQHTNMILKLAIMRRGEYKCRILEMNWKLRDQQLKIILYNIQTAINISKPHRNYKKKIYN